MTSFSDRLLLDTPKNDLRAAARSIPASVSIVSSVCADGELCTVTVSSLTTASLKPPLVVFYLKEASSTLRAIRSSGEFAATSLAAHQESVARCFSAPGRPRDLRAWQGVLVGRAPVTGLPVAVEGVAYFECRLVSCHTVGDHWGVLGQVVSCGSLRASAPLLHVDRGFTTTEGAGPAGR